MNQFLLLYIAFEKITNLYYSLVNRRRYSDIICFLSKLANRLMSYPELCNHLNNVPQY